MNGRRILDVRWLSLSYALRGAQMALDALSPGQALEITVDSFAATDLRNSLEGLGYKVDRLKDRGDGPSITLLAEKKPDSASSQGQR